MRGSVLERPPPVKEDYRMMAVMPETMRHARAIAALPLDDSKTERLDVSPFAFAGRLHTVTVELR
jgi:hypothetical protein